MNQLVTYEISKNIMYCPLIFNNHFLSDNYCRGNNHSVEESVFLNFLNRIPVNSTMYIVDIRLAIEKLSFSNKNLNKLKKKNIAYYCKKEFYNRFLKSHESKMIESDKECLSYNSNSDPELIKFIEGKLKGRRNIVKTIHEYVYIQFFLQEMKSHKHRYEMGHLKYLESSNVYVNRYINIKELFLQPKYMHFTIRSLAEKIETGYSESYRKACLLGVSNNGIILSRLLAYTMQLEARSINHIGPKYCLDSDAEFLKELKGKNFILISDVICLGGEYRMAKGILNALGAKLLGAVCIVKICDVYRESEEISKSDLFYSLVDDINGYEIDGEKINYHIYINKEGKNYEYRRN